MEDEKELIAEDNPTVLWVGVEVYGLITQGVRLFASVEDADEWFKGYTGFDYGTLYDQDGSCLNEDYDQTKIFVVSRDEVVALVSDLIEKGATRGAPIRFALIKK